MARKRASAATDDESRSRSGKAIKRGSTCSKRNHKQDNQQEGEQSPFLRLPPEIRNTIYEYAAVSTNVIGIDLDGILYSPPLSLACKQIRKEYAEIYIEEAPKYATIIKMQVTNFVHTTGEDSGKKDVFDVLDNLPPRVIEPKQRDYTLRVWVTNTFDNYLHQLRSFRIPPLPALKVGMHNVVPPAGDHPRCAVQINYEPKTFDVQYCKELLPKLRWSLGGSYHSPTCRNEWRMIEDAFNDAFWWYETTAKAAAKKGKQRVSFRQQSCWWEMERRRRES